MSDDETAPAMVGKLVAAAMLVLVVLALRVVLISLVVLVLFPLRRRSMLPVDPESH